MATLTTEPKSRPISVFDAKNREWVKKEFLWEWTSPTTGLRHMVSWETLSEFLGPIRDKK